MPRKACIDAAGALHHVIVRGIARRKVFIDTKSILFQEDAYLLELVRYIHLNPLRARRVADMAELDTYTYCGHGVVMGIQDQRWRGGMR